MSDWHSEETYKGLLQLSTGGLRFGALVNGGAAIALLALLGDLYGRGIDISPLRVAMIYFIVGIALAGLAHVTAYITQLALYEESALDKPETGIYQHRVFLWVSFLLVLGSIGTFCLGAYEASTIIASGGCSTDPELPQNLSRAVLH